MYKYLIFVIFGILLFIFLNTSESLNIGGQSTARRMLGGLPSEQGLSLDVGDIVSVDNTHEVPENLDFTDGPPPVRIDGQPVEELRIGDQGIVMGERLHERTTRVGYDPVLLMNVRIYRPSHNVDVNSNNALRRLVLGYAMNHRLIINSPLRNTPEDLLSLIVEWLNLNNRGYIGQYLIDARALTRVESPLDILRNILTRRCAARHRRITQ